MKEEVRGLKWNPPVQRQIKKYYSGDCLLAATGSDNLSQNPID